MSVYSWVGTQKYSVLLLLEPAKRKLLFKNLLLSVLLHEVSVRLASLCADGLCS